MNYKINFEIPTQWCNDHLVGGMVKNMTKNLIQALDRIGLEYHCFDYSANNEFIYNSAGEDTIVFLYHKKGRAKNTWYIKESAIPNFFSIDQGGYAGWSDFSTKNFNETDLINAHLHADFLSSYKNSRISKYPQMASKTYYSQSFVFFPLQLPHDTVVEWSYFDYYEAIYLIADLSSRYGVDLIIKRHPLCTDDNVAELLNALMSIYPNIKLSSDNIHDLIRAADAVICCNSGVGMEALIYSKRVYTYGHSDYSMATHQLKTEADLEMVFKSKFVDYFPIVEVGQFIDSYLGDYCFDSTSVESIEVKIKDVLRINFGCS